MLDFSVLFVSLQIAYQTLSVAKPNMEGLYRFRHSVYAINFALPCILVSCAFTESGRPYVSEGSFCHLPVRPLGYRLVLYWIPRYIVWVSILGIAIAIYVKTKFKLQMFEAVAMESTRSFRANSIFSHHITNRSAREDLIRPSNQELKTFNSMVTRTSRESSNDIQCQRFSKVSWSPEQRSIADPDGKSKWNNSIALSNMSSTTSTSPRSLESPPELAENVSMAGISRFSSCSQKPLYSSGRGSEISKRSDHDTSSAHAMTRRRRHIRKQLRLLFLYPIVYLLMWTIPLIAHAFKYNDRYAKRPLYSLTLLSVLCRLLIGFVDCVVFCAREKPWRHISSHDSTIMGSFLCWKGREGKDRAKGHRASITSVGTQDSTTKTSPDPSPEISVPPKVSNRSGYFRRLSGDVCQEESHKANERLQAERSRD